MLCHWNLEEENKARRSEINIRKYQAPKLPEWKYLADGYQDFAHAFSLCQ
jgi:hypothetical protein